MRAGVVLAALLAVGLTQSSGPPFGVRLSALPATTSSPSLSVTGEVVGLPAGVPVTVRLEARYTDPQTGKTVSRSVSGKTTYTPVQARPTLLRAYYLCVPQDVTRDGIECKSSTRYMRYTPRQYAAGLETDLGGGGRTVTDPGPYAGADVLVTPYSGTVYGYSHPKALYLELARAARVGIAWRKSVPLPAWLEGWEAGSDVQVADVRMLTRWKTLPAGTNWLPGWGGTNYAPHLLLLESDGTPSPAPTVPLGKEVPQPNQPCPPWVHEQYVTKGPDGNTYPTWHPQIDPVYWCYFGHEHGSDPTLAGNVSLPAYGYLQRVALATVPACNACHTRVLGRAIQEAPPYRYKTFVNTSPDGTVWLVSAEMGSDSAARLCQRHHEYHLQAYQGGVLMADLHWISDVGASLSPTHERRYKPALCPENLDIEAFQARRIPQIDTPGYESWQFGFPQRLGFLGQRVYVTDNPRTVCSAERDPEGSPLCGTMLSDERGYAGGPTPPKGENRWFTVPASVGFGLDAAGAMATGEFYTDPLALGVVSKTTLGAVRQYLAPGFRSYSSAPVRYLPLEGWRGEYRAITTSTAPLDAHDLEGGLSDRN